MPTRRMLFLAAPLAGAIGVYGIVFGAAASAEFGALPTIGMSALVFSGVVQFAVAALLSGGASVGAILLTVLALNARNLVLGAAIRPRLGGTRLQRALGSWFLVDESFGLAVASAGDAGRVMVISGALFYAAWMAGTVLGVVGTRTVALETIAAAIFPVLFVGLAAVTIRTRDVLARVVLAAVLVGALALAFPGARPFLPIAMAVAVSVPGGRRP